MDIEIYPLITENERKLPFCVKSIGGIKNQDHVYRPGGYPEYHWLHCVKGKGRLWLEGREYFISENMGFFFYPGVPHEYYTVIEPWETHWVTFNGGAVPPLLELLGLKKYGVYDISNISLIDRILDEIYLIAKYGSTTKGLECSVILYRFLMELMNCISTGDGRMKFFKQKKLQSVISYMEENYRLSITLGDLAQIIDITPPHLCRLFKEAFNMRPFVYLTRYRLNKAKELIISSGNLSIKNIAGEVGYNDVSYFCAEFKEHEGITPMEFKRVHRGDIKNRMETPD